MYRIRDFEQVYNICEGMFKKNEANFSVLETIEHIKVITSNELKKRHVTLKTNVSIAIPPQIRASEQLFRQIVLNLLHATVHNVVRSQAEVLATCAETETGHNVIIEVCNSRNELTKAEQQFIQEICMEEELSKILEADPCDVNLKIALVLARQLGWPIDFIVEG